LAKARFADQRAAVTGGRRSAAVFVLYDALANTDKTQCSIDTDH